MMKNVETIPESKVKKGSLFGKGIISSTKGISLSINIIFVGYVTFYCTDILGMKPSVIGIILLVSKLLDGVTDLIAGYLVDKTKTRWGKGRPYDLFLLVLWFFTVMLFSAPTQQGTAQIIWIFVVYTLINAVCVTFIGAADVVYLARAFRTNEERVTVSSVGGVLGMIAIVFFSTIMPLLIANLGTTAAGWRTIAVSLAIPLALIGMLRFLFIKEVVVESGEGKEKDKTSLKETVGLLSKNKYIFILAGIMLLAYIYNNMSTATTYYFKYIVGNIELQALTGMANFATPILLIFYPLLSNKLGNTKVLRGGMLIALSGIVIRIIGGTNLITIMIGTVLGLIGTVPITVMINLYLIECMDYGEWHTGKRIEGVIGSITSFAQKVGGGLAAILTGFIMGLAGYDGSLAVQSETANLSIIATYNYLPLVIFIIMFVLTMFYNLDKKLPTIHAELKERHEEAKK